MLNPGAMENSPIISGMLWTWGQRALEGPVDGTLHFPGPSTASMPAPTQASKRLCVPCMAWTQYKHQVAGMNDRDFKNWVSAIRLVRATIASTPASTQASKTPTLTPCVPHVAWTQFEQQLAGMDSKDFVNWVSDVRLVRARQAKRARLE